MRVERVRDVLPRHVHAAVETQVANAVGVDDAVAEHDGEERGQVELAERETVVDAAHPGGGRIADHRLVGRVDLAVAVRVHVAQVADADRLALQGGLGNRVSRRADDAVCFVAPHRADGKPRLLDERRGLQAAPGAEPPGELLRHRPQALDPVTVLRGVEPDAPRQAAWRGGQEVSSGLQLDTLVRDVPRVDPGGTEPGVAGQGDLLQQVVGVLAVHVHRAGNPVVPRAEVEADVVLGRGLPPQVGVPELRHDVRGHHDLVQRQRRAADRGERLVRPDGLVARFPVAQAELQVGEERLTLEGRLVDGPPGEGECRERGPFVVGRELG